MLFIIKLKKCYKRSKCRMRSPITEQDEEKEGEKIRDNSFCVKGN